MTHPEPAACAVALRRGVLAVSVLHDLDVEPSGLGVVLPGAPTVWVPWGECRRALAGCDPEAPDGRERLRAWLQARRWAADLGPRLVDTLRPLGLPVGHACHPGPDWVRERVLGGALELGLGAVGLDPDDPDGVVVVPPTVLRAGGLAVDHVWSHARRSLEELGALAADRLRLDPKGMLRPMGDCDVVTLLGARSLRVALAGGEGGMGAVAVPMRRRGWTKLGLIDPAFAPAAAAASTPQERGFPRPLLVTPDEVTVVPPGGRPTLVLRDPVAERTGGRDVLYR
jgi:hypothetical protein